jgi:hypothetical protein
VPDQREEDMLELMREALQALRRMENQINEIWAEWTRTHSSTIMKNVPLPERKVKRTIRA